MKELNKERNLKKVLIFLGVVIALVILNIWQSGSFYKLNQIIKNPKIQVFTIILLAILIEGFPFILIGSLISGSIDVLISEEKFKKFFP
ncbi:MAG: hypothetical protein NC921_04415, partial [Candidatus Omnitrophica bacterium]|nr:hypothetical protein [Candidatus Omnitrophota bacterium]